MLLTPGTRIGPYEVQALLGAGAMGEVYQVRDERLGRSVALKILPAFAASDPERLRRFEQEARAVGRLNHPNVVAVYDVGLHGETPYIVSELLEGETLRAQLDGGALPVRRAVDCAVQIARGLAAAHEKAVIHRDLKPENVFVTRDGRVKILDFGLAKPVRTLPSDDARTGGLGTEPGVILGTVGYLSPEQARGLPADHRSDIFSFGALLYEMLTGRRAFYAATPVETLSAILRDEPPPLPQADGQIPPALVLIVNHCLEKGPGERFQSAGDLAFDLESLSGSGSSAGTLAPDAVLRSRRAWPVAVGVVAGLILGVLGARLLWPPAAAPTFRQLTFRRGYVSSARFAPDGQTIFYSAAWQGDPTQVFSTRPESPESRALGFEGAELLSVSPSGELALCLRSRRRAIFQKAGTLGRVPFGGVAPREVLDEVNWADWSSDGTQLALVRSVEGHSRLEFPIGKVLHVSQGWISHPRVSTHGRRVAFIDHPVTGDDGGSVEVVDSNGDHRTLSRDWSSVQGVAWHGDEVWFAGARQGNHRDIHAVTLSGALRTIARAPGSFVLHDVSRDGRLLATSQVERGGTIALPPGATQERDVSWLDWSVVTDLSEDGTTFLFHEAGEGSARYAAYLGRTDGSPAIRLGDGESLSLSPDGRQALVLRRATSRRLILLSTGPGEEREVATPGIEIDMVRWFPDGRTLLLYGRQSGRPARLFVAPLAGQVSPRALTPEGFDTFGMPVSADSRFVVSAGPDGRLWIFPTQGGEPRLVTGSEPGDRPMRWSRDGKVLYLLHGGDELPVDVFRLDLAKASRERWRKLLPLDPAGVMRLGSELLAADEKSYVYSYARVLSDLYLVDGLR